MIILAPTSNDKGKQLETLTRNLLRHRGYENCTTNVMANGAEIDVRGELPLPGLGAIQHRKLICECKAHKALMDMTQWCKFLGKVFHQEVCSQAEVAGCFVSLSGVNGHVQGNYDELSKHKESISLLHGDELLKLIAEITPFVSLTEISRRCATITNRTPSRFEPAYHDGKMFWVVVFSGGDYTILSANGLPIESELAESLPEMVETELDVSSYIDIEQESEAQLRAAMAQVLVVATLFSANGSVDSIEALAQIEDFTTEELKVAARALVDEGHLQESADGKLLVPTTTTDDGELVTLDIYRILFAYRFPNNVLQADFYQSHINKAFLNEVCKVQAGLPLSDVESDELIALLRLSPSAVAQSLRPMPMIVVGRETEQPNQHVDRFHQDYFRQRALEALKQDFHTAELAEFFHKHRGFRELEYTSKLILKSEAKVEKEAGFTERIGIRRAADSLGGGLLHVAMLKYAPQPWEPLSAWNSSSDETQDPQLNGDA